LLQDIITFIEEKFNKYFKYFSTIFYLFTIIDPHIKFEGCKYSLDIFYEKMNYSDSAIVWIDIDNSINNLYHFYESQFEINSHLLFLHLHRSLEVLYYLFISCIEKIEKLRQWNELYYYSTRSITHEIDAEP